MFSELLWALPFFALLLSIALFPLLKPHWWEKHYPAVSLALGLVVVFHYVFQLKQTEVLFTTLHEYFSFIALIGSLFIISGGIYIQTKGEATPLANCLFLVIASCTASLLGTTGASMVFIRPWIRINKYRFTALHIVFFIFLVSNIGGGLTPIGDPPLFLGYLKGVPFFWVIQHVWIMWAITTAYLIAVFFVLDTINFRKAPPAIREKETGHEHTWKFRGGQNIFYLALVIGSVFINHPPFLREAVMIIASLLSYATTARDIHSANDFSFKPIKEVAILFLGIFLAMIPALEWLERYAGQLGVNTPSVFYWLGGALSSVLDNAPTYLNFLSLEIGLFTKAAVAAGAAHLTTDDHAIIRYLMNHHPDFIMAISVSTVYFGAMTYIGNGPNFLVKSIADHSKLHTPSFFGYILKYSIPILLPIFILIGWVFFR
jgi:Na+/H+ antiporter NhaD/arsenite permease-like protein